MVIDYCLLTLFSNWHIFLIINKDLSLIAWISNWLLTTILIVGSRIMANVFFIEKSAESRAIIYGAGSAGIQLSVALSHSQEMKPVCFIDKDPSLHDTYVGGLKVLAPDGLEKMISKNPGQWIWSHSKWK